MPRPRLPRLIPAAILALLLPLVLAVPASAQTYYYYQVVTRPAPAPAPQPVAARLPWVAPAASVRYGPFRVLDDQTAALVGITDARSPAAFRAMLRDYPHLARLKFLECPGTYDDRANLALGRMIRAAGLVTEVPNGGSVRSGAVELVLAGTSLMIADGAEFAVHAWEDDAGYEATDYAADSPENRRYLAYYREMGLADPEGFYAMTNSVHYEDARWLDGVEMRQWIGARAAPRLAYLDLGPALN